MITRKHLFAFFPKDWSYSANSMREIAEGMYDEIEREVSKFQFHFGKHFFKENRVNFDICNIHIAHVNNGVVKEFKKSGINNLFIYDEVDNKPRFIMDVSKGMLELEAVHPLHAIDDSHEVQNFMNDLKSGKVNKTVKNSENFFDKSDPELSVAKLENVLKIMMTSTTSNSKLIGVLTELLTILLKQQSVYSGVNDPDDGKDLKKPSPDYVG